MQNVFFQIFLLVMLGACSGPSPEKVRAKAQKVKKELLSDLRKVEKTRDLEENFSTFQAHFHRLGELMVEGKRLGSDKLPVTEDEELIARALQQEMGRVLRLTGAGKVLELAQEQGLKEIEQANQ